MMKVQYDSKLAAVILNKQNWEVASWKGYIAPRTAAADQQAESSPVVSLERDDWGRVRINKNAS